MHPKFLIALGLAASTLTACDEHPEDRSVLVETLADPDLDPELRAELSAELVADDLAAPPVDPAGLTCFFCPPPPTLDPSTYVPVVIHPQVQVNQQGNTILFMDAASSFITLPGATVQLQVPGQQTTYGPYALSFDQSGTLVRANVSGGFPPGSCRSIVVTNPNNKSSAPSTLCR